MCRCFTSFLALGVLCLSAPAPVTAQTQQGSVLIGGTAGMSSTKTGDLTVTDFNFHPMASFFVVDRLALGGALGVGRSRATSGDAAFTTTTFSVLPTMRYYFNGRGSIRSFGQGAFRYGYTRWNDPDLFGLLPSRSASSHGTGWAWGVGVDFFLNDHVAIEGVVGYDHFRLRGDRDATRTLGVSFGVSAFVGAP